MPERVFWREMCPVRLIALFDAHFKPRRAPTVGPGQSGEPMGIYTAISQMGGF